MTADIDFVVSEVRDMLRAGRVGLYEFTKLLRGRYPSASAAELAPTSQEALSVLLANGDVALGTYRWTEPAFRADASNVTVTLHDWETPPEEAFLGLEFIEQSAATSG